MHYFTYSSRRFKGSQVKWSKNVSLKAKVGKRGDREGEGFFKEWSKLKWVKEESMEEWDMIQQWEGGCEELH